MVRLPIYSLLTLVSFFAELGRATPATNLLPTPKEVLSVLQRRQNTCPTTAPVSCAAVDSKLPDNFCCRAGSSCISLDSSTSALCCPDGSSCSTIQAITCDITVQDPANGRREPVFTTRLNDTLPVCSGTDKCCPFGYTCAKNTDGSAICQLIANRAIVPSSASSASPASSATSALRTSPSSASVTSNAGTTSSTVSPASASSIDSTKPGSSPSTNPFPPTVFLAGFFPGLLVGALGVLAWVIFTGRHKKPNDNASVTSSIYKRKPYISGPVAMDSQNTRTDFLRKGGSMAKGLFSKRGQGDGTPGLPFDNWKMPTPPEQNNIPDQPVGRQVPAGPGAKPMNGDAGYSSTSRYPVTPERQIYGDQARPGTEEIHVYSPRDMDAPSATVPPLRGMHSRDRSRKSAGENYFVTPDRAANARPSGSPAQTPNYPYEATYEMLTPARYEGDRAQKRQRPENAGYQSRPETTFTDMLEAINFPDPMNRQAPRMPEVPRQYR